MTTYQWARPVSGDWTTASRWTPTGGPQLSTDPELSGFPVTDGDAVFATGSTKTYTISGKAIANSLNVVGDHVNIKHFGLENWATSTFGVFGGAVVSIGADSYVSLMSHDAIGGYSWVDASRLTVHGNIDLGTGAGFDITSGSSVTVSGKGASVGQDSYGLGRIDQTSSLTVSHGGTWGVSNTVDGAVNLSNGTLSGWTGLNPGASLTGYGTAARVWNEGSIEANGGTLRLGVTAGTGSLQIDANAKLDLGAPTDTNVTFNGSNAWLMLEPGAQAMGFISGFGNGDKIETVGQNLTSLQLQDDGVGNTVMSAFSGSTLADTFHFAGNLSPHLKLQHDGHGDSIIAYSNSYQPDPTLYMAPIQQVT
jgi:fibronectin-binding autotransporter adhesin